ncbi:RNA polymerase-associated protein [Moraxella cuniculi DSM 21768]|uniref:RNA polymerase-associated protein n=2 Tax=Moraxella cuniculi TaxID=34061 RepID=A0A1N7DB70_9GAMM|nr:glutathione S-transferase N-terminal domain-containing protein [Moraxella cuniculi]OOS07952.1 starvation protein A [Moraxella cuniculi]SIR73078.1 RNA polymerase-associated protein [Moraxella cuniculi DSM 21768]VEG13063.1 Stringent starvation protein A [Moraxella cuniculi]
MANSAHCFSTQFTLYADHGLNSHVVRLLLEEKQLDYRLIVIEDERPEELIELNPYHTLPILVNRDVALYEINVIFEYLEERHQAPRLLPAMPSERAKMRQLAWRIQKDWLSQGYTLLTHPDSFDEIQAHHAKKSLCDSLVTLAPLFGYRPYFMSDDFGWCDVLLLPLLWRLPQMNISLPTHLVKPLLDYQTEQFSRKSFLSSINFEDIS